MKIYRRKEVAELLGRTSVGLYQLQRKMAEQGLAKRITVRYTPIDIMNLIRFIESQKRVFGRNIIEKARKEIEPLAAQQEAKELADKKESEETKTQVNNTPYVETISNLEKRVQVLETSLVTVMLNQSKQNTKLMELT